MFFIKRKKNNHCCFFCKNHVMIVKLIVSLELLLFYIHKFLFFLLENFFSVWWSFAYTFYQWIIFYMLLFINFHVLLLIKVIYPLCTHNYLFFFVVGLTSIHLVCKCKSLQWMLTFKRWVKGQYFTTRTLFYLCFFL